MIALRNFKLSVFLISAFAFLSVPAVACTIGEEVQAQLPFNATDISNRDRLAIADIVIEARKWPDVEIQAVVIAGAYKRERNVERLKETRAENVKAYLRDLGIKGDNILIDRKTFTDEMVARNSDGALTVHQVVVELTPICKGSCAWLCNDPRVTPTTKAIR